MRHYIWAYDNAGEYWRMLENTGEYIKKCKTSNSTFIKLQFVRIRSNNNFKITSIKFHSTKIINKDKDFDILKMNHIQNVLYFLNMQFVPWNIQIYIFKIVFSGTNNSNKIIHTISLNPYIFNVYIVLCLT